MKRIWIAAAVIATVTVGVPAVRSSGVVEAQQSDLNALESALSATPDDLKAGNDYRMAVIKVKQYDRALSFFKNLTTTNPGAPNAHLNYGFAYVDKIPDAGAITQVILANNALGEFTKSLELKPSWIGLYTRGNSYLFWPKIFGRTKYGIADLTEALKIQKGEPKRHYHVRVYVALGDGYWKSDDLVQASSIWREGLAQFPESEKLQTRVAKQGEDLKTVIEADYDPAKRVDTSLQDLWTDK